MDINLLKIQKQNRLPCCSKKNSAGFTLIELLVVISIVSLLASVILVSLNGARAKARDAKRTGDMEQLSKALEMHYADTGQYPQVQDAYSIDLGGSCSGPITNGGPSVSAVPGCGWCNRWCYLSSVLNPYLSQMPKDPTNNSFYYYYYQNEYVNGNNGQSYGVAASSFEDPVNVQQLSKGNNTFPTGIERGPAINYCSGKYAGSNAGWRWNGNDTLCVGGN